MCMRQEEEHETSSRNACSSPQKQRGLLEVVVGTLSGGVVVDSRR